MSPEMFRSVSTKHEMSLYSGNCATWTHNA